jgi:[protein-PII] uridylyltransferase
LPQAFHGGTALFLFTPQKYFTFAAATAVLDELGLNIMDARIIQLRNQCSLTTFVITEQNGEQIHDQTRLEQIRHRLTRNMASGADAPMTVTRRAPRQVRLFDTPTIVNFTQDEANQRTLMEIIAGDRPGQLCEIGQVLRSHEIMIQTAKVLTIGERAEDVFYITNNADNPLSPEEREKLETDLLAALSDTMH